MSERLEPRIGQRPEPKPIVDTVGQRQDQPLGIDDEDRRIEELPVPVIVNTPAGKTPPSPPVP